MLITTGTPEITETLETVETSGTEGRQTMGTPATAYNSGAPTAERTSTTARSIAASETTGS
jgi:hypothetical protein